MNPLEEMLKVIALAEAYWEELRAVSSDVRRKTAECQIEKIRELRKKFESGEFKIEVKS